MNTYVRLGVGAVLCAGIGLQYGCSTMHDGEPGIQVLPDIRDCYGKMSLTATGSLTSALGAGASNQGTLMADCGDGFRLIHGRPDDNDNQ